MSSFTRLTQDGVVDNTERPQGARQDLSITTAQAHSASTVVLRNQIERPDVHDTTVYMTAAAAVTVQYYRVVECVYKAVHPSDTVLFIDRLLTVTAPTVCYTIKQQWDWNKVQSSISPRLQIVVEEAGCGAQLVGQSLHSCKRSRVLTVQSIGAYWKIITAWFQWGFKFIAASSFDQTLLKLSTFWGNNASGEQRRHTVPYQFKAGVYKYLDQDTQAYPKQPTTSRGGKQGDQKAFE
ncbi:hypothetical protein J6590_031423 [Homalodisca vitripennis]|nr:hypothetical protein J6590_031423 [Homalodisca vitripennis]